MEYDKIVSKLRDTYCKPESCKNCSETGRCKTQTMLEAADAIEKLTILANNYRKALEAMR